VGKNVTVSSGLISDPLEFVATWIAETDRRKARRTRKTFNSLPVINMVYTSRTFHFHTMLCSTSCDSGVTAGRKFLADAMKGAAALRKGDDVACVTCLVHEFSARMRGIFPRCGVERRTNQGLRITSRKERASKYYEWIAGIISS
jgi:hypothetical protein